MADSTYPWNEIAQSVCRIGHHFEDYRSAIESNGGWCPTCDGPAVGLGAYVTGRILQSVEPVPARNHFPWNEAQGPSGHDPVAAMLMFGLNAICEHLADLTEAIRGRG